MDDRVSQSGDMESDDTVNIVRDSTFVRFVADRLVVADLGRDLEIACLQTGPIHSRIIDRGDMEEFDSQSVATEVARMRISYGVMVQTVMSFLHGAIQEDRIKGPAIVTQLDQWVKTYARENKEDD
ncbi:MAG TPA: hypothetical protein VF650_15605 [Allosphingosinicella sp.]|jgi:hypothetical protein